MSSPAQDPRNVRSARGDPAGDGAGSIGTKNGHSPSQDNPLITPPNNLWNGADSQIAFDRIKPEHFPSAVDHHIKQATTALDGVAKLEGVRTFENSIAPFVCATVGLNRTVAILNWLVRMVPTDELRQVAQDIEPIIAAFRGSIWQNAALHQAIADYGRSAMANGVTPEQQHAVKQILEQFELGGFGIDETNQGRVVEINQRLGVLGQEFLTNVTNSRTSAPIIVKNEDQLRGLNNDKAAVGAWRQADQGMDWFILPVDQATYTRVMERAENRELRQCFFRAMFGDTASSGAHDNTSNAREQLSLRAEYARLVGREDGSTWCDIAARGQMLESGAAVRELVERLARDLKPIWQAEVAIYAKTRTAEEIEREGAVLEPWDVPFYARRSMARTAQFEEERLAPYLEVRGTFDRLRGIIAEWGDVTFQRVNLPTYHPDVQTFAVCDKSGILIGYLYADIFARPDKGKEDGARVDVIAPRVPPSNGREASPFILSWEDNQQPSSENNPSFCGPAKLRDLVHEAGHALHAITCEARSQLPSQGFGGLALDFAEGPALLFEALLQNPVFLRRLACHHSDGSPLPDEVVEPFVLKSALAEASFVYRLVGLALLDNSLHTHFSAEENLVGRAKEILLPFMTQMPDWYSYILSFVHIFGPGGDYAGKLHSYAFSAVQAADLAEPFSKVGHEALDEIGRRFVERMLAPGASLPPGELYQRWTGHQPDPAAFVRLCRERLQKKGTAN